MFKQRQLSGPPDHYLNLKLMGGPNTGKSCLIQRAASKKFILDPLPFTEEQKTRLEKDGISTKPRIDVQHFSLEVNFSRVKMTLCNYGWEFGKLENTLFQGRSHGILLICDLTDRVSFHAVKSKLLLLRDVMKKTGQENLPLFLVGTKSDDSDNQQVSNEELRQFSEENNFSGTALTSAKTGEGVNNLFSRTALSILTNIGAFSDHDESAISLEYT